MRRSATYDFGYVLDGEVVLELDDGEAHLAARDLVVQNGARCTLGTTEATAARMLFVCIGAHLDA